MLWEKKPKYLSDEVFLLDVSGNVVHWVSGFLQQGNPGLVLIFL